MIAPGVGVSAPVEWASSLGLGERASGSEVTTHAHCFAMTSISSSEGGWRKTLG